MAARKWRVRSVVEVSSVIPLLDSSAASRHANGEFSEVIKLYETELGDKRMETWEDVRV